MKKDLAKTEKQELAVQQMKTSIALSIQKCGQLRSIEFYHKRTEFKKIAKLSYLSQFLIFFDE